MTVQVGAASAYKWDEEADVVVVGYGYAGGIAALEARKAGADTLLIEKMPDPGGISITSGGNIRAVADAEEGFAYLQATRRTYEGDAPASELYTWLRYTSHQGSEQPLGLQVNVTTRYTRPYMYEWPWGIRADQHFAPSGTSLSSKERSWELSLR